MFKKRFGQHFLHDENYLRKIVDASGLSSDEACLEIGAGDGRLTRRLAERARRVTAVEIDRELVPALRRNVPDTVTIIEGDFLDLDLERILDGFSGKWRVVANLPYQITSPVIFRLLERAERFEGIFLLIQREVARRVASPPGSKEYGTLSVQCQIAAECGVAFRVPPGVFSPPPEVESALLTMIPRKKPLFDAGDLEVFRALVRGAFEHRRKTCYNSLLIAFDRGFCAGFLQQGAAPGGFLKSALEKSGILPEQRPETISIEQFAKLSCVVTREIGGKRVEKT